ncbi:MAG: rubredoxin [Candidatus Zixiibacteriota bacterium]
MKKFRCTVCGYIHEGNDLPDKCPRCGASKEKFEQIPEDKVKLIDRSRFTNGLHKKLFTILGEVEKIATSGMEDNLDPACVAIFTQAKQEAVLIRAFIRAELEVHMSKGKWG